MKNYILLLVILFSTRIVAQPGSLDTTFNVGTGTNSYILTSLIQEDGTTSNSIARLSIDGSLDTSFSTGVGTEFINARAEIKAKWLDKYMN